MCIFEMKAIDVDNAKILVEKFFEENIKSVKSINYEIMECIRLRDYTGYEDYINIKLKTDVMRNYKPAKNIVNEIYDFDDVYLLCDDWYWFSTKKETKTNKRTRTITRDVYALDICVRFKDGKFINDFSEYDRNETAWLLYEERYLDKISNYRKKEGIASFSYLGETIDVSGDCCFNFNIKKYRYFEDIINNGTICESVLTRLLETNKTEEEYRRYLLGMLRFCKMYHHSPVNIALMPTTGGMNNLKQQLANDRFDTFLWILSTYFSGCDSMILGGNMYVANRNELNEFLKSFKGSLFEYCDNFYPSYTEQKTLITEIIESGKRAMISPVDVHRYMVLAYKFWSSRFLANCMEVSFEVDSFMKAFADKDFNSIIESP